MSAPFLRFIFGLILAGSASGAPNTAELTFEARSFPAPLAKAHPAALHDIPVVSIRFLPVDEGFIDSRKAPNFREPGHYPVEAVNAKIDMVNQRLVYALTEGSRFRGYKFPNNPPSLGYRVVADFVCYDQPPANPNIDPHRKGGRPLDYKKIMAAIDGERLVNELGVKEFWVWFAPADDGFPGARAVGMDPNDYRCILPSNMASPTTGDVTNTNDWDDDLPIYKKTYIVYEDSIYRPTAAALIGRGQQLAFMFSHAATQQDGNDDFFWRKFAGRNSGVPYRMNPSHCGAWDYTPNGSAPLDCSNSRKVRSDIEDWNPDGTAPKKRISEKNWSRIHYEWPAASQPVALKDLAQWIVYWMQAMPGHDNRIPSKDGALTNWWLFVADWDKAMTEKQGLYTPGPPVPFPPLEKFPRRMHIRQ